MMSKNAWSPGRSRRSEKVCGCGRAAVAGDRVDRLDVLRAQLEQQLHRRRDDLVLGHARAQHRVDLLVDRVDDPGGLVEQRQLVLALHAAAPRASPAGSRSGGSPCAAARARSSCRARRRRSARPRGRARAARAAIELGEIVRNARRVGHRAAHRRHPGAPARLRQPRAVELVMLAPPSRSPRGSGRPRGTAARSGCSCRAPTCRSRCSSHSAGCWGRTAAAPRGPTPPASPSRGASRWRRSRSKSTRCSQSTAILAPRDAIAMLASTSGWCSAILHNRGRAVNTCSRSRSLGRATPSRSARRRARSRAAPRAPWTPTRGTRSPAIASATVPPPACRCATPSLTTTVRMWIAVSSSPV